MRFFIGTSGFSYREWKGSFYPQKLPQKDMLSYYAREFSAVEINNTFYRMPSESVLESWARQVPNQFRFVLKAPQAITHRKRLKDVDELTHHFLRTASALKKRLGPVLFQLPPNFKKDLPRLEIFLNLFKGRPSVVFEFRHESWFVDEVFACLRARACTLCVADSEELPSSELVSTSPLGFLRLRRKQYTARQLSKWIDKIESRPWDEVYVFFKHEDTGTGPKLAKRLLKLMGS